MAILTQRSLINLFLLIGTIILAICGLFAYRELGQLVKANEWIVHTEKVISVSNIILLNITTGEAKLNYSLLTNDQTIITDLPSLLKTADQNVDVLKQLTKDNPIQSIRAKELDALIDARILMMKEIVGLLNAKNRTTAIQLATGQKRLVLRRKIIENIADIINEEVVLLEQRNNAVVNEIKKSHLLFLLFGMLSVLLIILSFILLNYNLYQRDIARRKQLEAENQLKLSNERLKTSEERYLLATEGSSAGLWDWEVGTDHVFYAPYFKKMLGYSEEEFPNSLQSFEKVIHPNDHDRVWDLIAEHLKNHVPYKIEYRLKTKSGKYNWFEAAGVALWNKDGKATRMSGSIIDITDRKKAEQRLHIQYTLAELISEASSLEKIGIQIIKEICQGLDADLGCLWMVKNEHGHLQCIGTWSQPVALLKQFVEESMKTQLLYGEGLPGRVWQEGKPLWFADVDKNPHFSRAEIAKACGLHSALVFPIIIQQKVLGVIEVFTQSNEQPEQRILDLMKTVGAQIGLFITRKAAENDLRQSEAYNAAVLSSVSDSIITINKDKKIVSFNMQTMQEFKYSDQELKNLDIESMLPTIHLEDSSIDTTELIAIRKNEEKFPVEIKISKMFINNEEMFVVTVRNITERKKIEKMKNEFVSVVSHELRTPLTSIRGALGLVLGGTAGELSEKIKKLLELANNNCERLLLLINDILDIEKIEAGKMKFDFKVVNLNKLVEENVLANQMFAKKYNVNLILNESEKFDVNVDADRLNQVLTNLISNAVKFSPQGETVTLSIKKNEKQVRVLVSNKGVGISPEFQSRIFEKFSQADTSTTRGKGGTGLGLNISRTIIEKLGGTLNFVSKPNEITTFYFDLPIWNLIEKSVTREVSETEKEKDKILICEDDEDQANYVGKLLETTGFAIDIAYTVAEAKEFLKQNKYAILLLDLILPDQDGLAFIRELRSNETTRTLPIIVLSIIAQTGKSLINGETFSVMDWLDKPIDFDKLLHAIEHIKKKTYPKLPNILHVEDDPDTLEIIHTLLENHANVVSATTLQESKQKLKNFKFDLLILDLLLPDGNAEELLPLLSLNKIPVIIYSALELHKSFPSIVKHVLVKSKTSNERLLNLIKHVLETST